MTVRLTRVEAGKYVTADGRYEIGKDSAPTDCYDAHPGRVTDRHRELYAKDPNNPLLPFDVKHAIMTGAKGYYCPGGEEHEETYWYVWDIERNNYLDGCEPAQNVPTKKDAVANLEYHLARA